MRALSDVSPAVLIPGKALIVDGALTWRAVFLPRGMKIW